MFSIYRVLEIIYPLAKFNQSRKGLEGVEIGAGSQIKDLKQTQFRIIPSKHSQSLALLVLDSLIYLGIYNL